MKKILCIFLCLCMALSVIAVFSACKKKPEIITGPQVSEEVVTVNLTDYKIVFPSTITTSCRQQAVSLSTLLREGFGLDIRPVNDVEKTSVQTPDLEILVGKTKRVETDQALAEIEGDGWIIKTINSKIVIVGTTDYLTRVAFAYFIDNYMNAEKIANSAVTMNQRVIVSNQPMVSLVKDGAGQYSVVYSDRLDDKKGSEFGNEPAGTTYDHEYDIGYKIRTTLITLTRVSATTFPLKTDADEAAEKEILVGNINRAETQEQLKKLGSNDYAVISNENKIIVTAWTQVAMDAAYAEFDAIIQESICTDADGNNFVAIPADLSIVKSLDNEFVLDFPKPTMEGLTLIDSVDVSDNCMLFVYAGAGANRANYVAYCEMLEKEGFALYAPETQSEGSSFRYYYNSNTGVILYVTHAAYIHADEQDVDNFTPSIRIVSGHTDYISHPDAEILNADRSWVKRTETKITMLQLKYGTGNFGLSAVLTLEDGSFIIFDGGGAGKTRAADDENYMYNVLVDLYKQTYGHEPTERDPLHIRGWIITHEHWDHQMVFYNFCKEYGNYKTILIDRLFYNPASDEETYNCYNPESSTQTNLLNGTIDKFLRGDDFEWIKVHSGQKFYLANAELDVLYTHEDIHPQQLEYFNNSSTIFRITLHTTSSENDVVYDDHIVSSQVSVWLGDLERVGSKCLRAMYGDTLKSDIVQVSHHGYNGVEKELYAIIDPEIVLWPTESSQWITQTKNAKSGTWYYQVDYFVAHELPNVKLINVSEYYNTTITFNANGPDYDNLWDALEHKKIETDSGAVGATAARVIYRP